MYCGSARPSSSVRGHSLISAFSVGLCQAERNHSVCVCVCVHGERDGIGVVGAGGHVMHVCGRGICFWGMHRWRVCVRVYLACGCGSVCGSWKISS